MNSISITTFPVNNYVIYKLVSFYSHTYSYALFWLGFSVVVPSVVITFCYVSIFKFFKSARAAVASHRVTAPTTSSPLSVQPSRVSGLAVSKQQGSNDCNTPSNTTVDGSSTNKTAKKKSANLMRSISSKEDDERKLLRSLFLVLVAFLVCWYDWKIWQRKFCLF